MPSALQVEGNQPTSLPQPTSEPQPTNEPAAHESVFTEQLLSTPGDDNLGSWSPDGKKIGVFSNSRGLSAKVA